nr:hypothetical protein [Tanacetum cinerariifolium]
MNFKINTKKRYYQRCATCEKQVIPGDPIPRCKTHGPQSATVYSGSTKRKRYCVLDRVFKHQLLPLPAPPVESVTLLSTSHGQPEQMPKPKPASPALSTSTSNEPDISEIDTKNLERPQFIPPPAQEIIAAQKEDKAANLKPTYDDVTSSMKME